MKIIGPNSDARPASHQPPYRSEAERSIADMLNSYDIPFYYKQPTLVVDIHLDLGRGLFCRSQNRQAPSRLRRDQNNVSTVPGSRVGPSQGRDRTSIRTGPVEQSLQLFVTPGTGERGSQESESYPRATNGGGGRPIIPQGLNHGGNQDRPPPRGIHPNTRVRSKTSCRFIM